VHASLFSNQQFENNLQLSFDLLLDL